jgi:hypothetical protein
VGKGTFLKSVKVFRLAQETGLPVVRACRQPAGETDLWLDDGTIMVMGRDGRLKEKAYFGYDGWHIVRWCGTGKK